MLRANRKRAVSPRDAQRERKTVRVEPVET
jgi:hypothetical protein